MRKFFIHLFLICLSSQIIKAQTLFCDDFENGPNGWYILTSSGNIDWQLDTFSIGSTPNHVWQIGLDSGYGSNEKAILSSPVYNVISPLNLSVCFLLQYGACFYEDGMRVDFSVDGGLTWSVLGNGGQINWYDSYFITSSGGLPGWSLSSPFWTHVYYDYGTISAINVIQFRFVFTSVINSVCANSGYFIIDNFCVCSALSCNCSSTTGIEEQFYSNNSFPISPNPASDEFQINLTFQKDDEIIFSDATGKILFTKKINSPTSPKESLRTNLKFQTSNFSNGIYFLELKTKEGIFNKKVVVQH